MTGSDMPIEFEALQETVRYGPRVLPVAGRTKPGLSEAVPDDAIALDVSGLRGITEYDPAELTLTALAGTPVRDVVSALGDHDQYLPFDPLLVDAGATLGGTVASAASGSCALRHGGVRDFVIGVRFVDGLGDLVSGGGKVVKNAAGFDLPKLMVGSMGRLGVLVQLSFKVFPKPRATVTLAFELGSREAELTAITRLAGGPIQLDAIDLDETGRTLVRLGGEPETLAPRAVRVAAMVDADATSIEGDADASLWHAARELTWAPAGSRVVRVVLTGHHVTALDASLMPFAAPVRYALAANVAWIAWPSDRTLGDLDTVLTARGLTGTVLTGDADRHVCGVPPGGSFGARIRRALDPNARFLEA